MTTTTQLSENSHQGFDGIKAALCLRSMEVKSNTASGMPLCLWREGIGSRSTGKERDQETGLDYFGARYMSSAQGRFISPDPLLNSGHPNNPQSWNRYVYVENNPLRYTDPTGLYTFANSTCGAAFQACEKAYKKNKDAFNSAYEWLKFSQNNYTPGSLEYSRIDSALKALGTKNDKTGPTIVFDKIAGKAAAGTSQDGNTITVDPDKFKGQDTAKWLAPDIGQEGTHRSDIIAIGKGADQLSGFSMEIRGYETSAFVFQGVFGQRTTANAGTGTSFSPETKLDYGYGVIWNTAWAAVDQTHLDERNKAIRSTVLGIYTDPDHTPTSMPASWKGK
jgi:RHS repeat-associated protein